MFIVSETDAAAIGRVSDQGAGGCPPLQNRAGTVIVSPATSIEGGLGSLPPALLDAASALWPARKKHWRSTSRSRIEKDIEHGAMEADNERLEV